MILSTRLCPYCEAEIYVWFVQTNWYCPVCTKTIRPIYEVVCFTRDGKDWFSVKNLMSGRVETLSWDEYLASVDHFLEEGVCYGEIQRPQA